MCQVDDVICFSMFPSSTVGAVLYYLVTAVVLRWFGLLPSSGIFLAHPLFVRSRRNGRPHGLEGWSHPALVAKTVAGPCFGNAAPASVFFTLTVVFCALPF